VAAATGSEDNVSEMMGRLRLTAAEAAAVVLDDGGDDFQVHSQWAVVGKVLSPNKLHISTISAALRPAWGNPRGLVFNSAGENIFVAEFNTKADKVRVVDGPPWVVGRHAVLLRDFDVDQKPSEMYFNSLKVWARIINLPFGYMHKRWGAVIASPLGVNGSVPMVECDDSGRCWGGYMRVRVEVDVDKPLMRGVTVFSQRRNVTEWFQVQYENLPLYCFSCGCFGHSSTECKDPGERDAEGKLPYSADKLCAPDERKKAAQAAKSYTGSASAGKGQDSSRQSSGRNDQSANKSGAARQQSKNDESPEVHSPVKKRQSRARTTTANTRKDIGKGKDDGQDEGRTTAGRKRKQVYKPKAAPPLEESPSNMLALVVHSNSFAQGIGEVHTEEALSKDSNKRTRLSGDNGSADQAGAVDQPRQTQ
jgi:hypothetical protein